MMSLLRINQGLYAPFKLSMEKQFATKVNRLPCLKSSNLMLSVLKGTDETLEIEDIFNSKICRVSKSFWKSLNLIVFVFFFFF
jgi:proteasome maturation protein